PALPDMTVSDLLVLNEKRWNTALIRSIFDDSSAEKILHTPLIDSVIEDKVIWRLEKNGIYSVKSAYRYCIDEAIDTTGLRAYNEDQAAHFMTVLWSIWQQRNNKVWHNNSELVQVVCARTTTLLVDWRGAQNQHSPNNSQLQHRSVTRWVKPQLGRYKCNIDASFSVQHNKVGIGMCIRDDQGRFVLAKTEWISPILDVDIGEALGLLSALNWVHDLRLKDVDFELDSQNVVTRFHSKREDMSEFGDVIKDC
ncbi:cytochrome P450, partial [Trifolium medium]|nr:cytochrome P450 [Trifolium medium]